MKSALTLTIVLLVSNVSSAQKQGNIWYFGDHAGISFNSNTVTPIHDGETYLFDYLGIQHSEGTASICDNSGSLLFYTNGAKVWNRYHEVMPNGDSLLGHPSSTQAALIVPQPNSNDIFYIFTTDAFLGHNLKNGLRYSVVDMRLNNCSGDVVNAKKNILLTTPVAEKLTGVKHANNRDYWIITHKFYSDSFYCYLLTPNGITDTVISKIGSRHPKSGRNIWEAIGQLKASPNGNKLAIVSGNSSLSIAELFDFDKSTGVISNMKDLQDPILTLQYYGISFSPDNTKLYLTASSISSSLLIQYDITAGNGNPDSIQKSRYVLASTPSSSAMYGLQLGPDNKIYIARFNQPYLSLISNPNKSNESSGFIDTAINLGNDRCSYSLPSFIDSYKYNNVVPCTQSNNNDTCIALIYPNPFHENITISWGCSQSELHLKLYNSIGQLLYYSSIINGQSINIKKPKLASGIYFYLLIDEKQKKLIKSGKLFNY